MRDKTKIKNQVVVREFQRLLRSGKDYTNEYMYSEAGKKGFIEGVSASNNIILPYYWANEITGEMKDFILDVDGKSFKTKTRLFSRKFNKCIRESKYILIVTKNRSTSAWRKDHVRQK